MFRFVSWNQKQKFWFVLVCFGVSNLYQNNRNKQNCFETNRNNPKFSLKYQNMLSIKLFRLAFFLFRFNRNCCSIEAKQPKQTVTTCNHPKQPDIFWKKYEISSLSNCFCCYSVCFGSIKTPNLSLSVKKQNNRNW